MRNNGKFTKDQYQEMGRAMNMTDKTVFIFSYEGANCIMIWKICLN